MGGASSKTEIKQTYSDKYKSFVSTKLNAYKGMIHDSVFEKINGLYIPLFQIMDICKKNEIKCNLKNIIGQSKTNLHLLQIVLPFMQILNCLGNQTSPFFDKMLDELQLDINIIENKGFLDFESKIIEILESEIESKKEYDRIIARINNLVGRISELHSDNVLN